MFTWSCEHRVETSAGPEAVWAVWADWRRWPEWDEAIEWIEGEGPFEAGARGRMKPKGGPAMRTLMLEATPPAPGVNPSFTGRSLFPLCPMDAYHVYEPAPRPCCKAAILHRVTFTGPIAPLLGLVIGGRIRAELETSMVALKARAEAITP
jgi:hypothetical protein